MHSTIKKGYAGEYFVLGDLTLKGISAVLCAIPTSEYDIIAESESRFLKIQVKSGEFENGKMRVDIRRPSSKERLYTESDYDLLAVVELKSRKVAYFPFDIKSKMTLHEHFPKKLTGYQNQFEVKLFDDYLKFPSLSEIGNRSNEINANDGGNRQAV